MKGRIAQSSKGTLFLDEIGDMPQVMQAKLLRVLEEGEIERVGGAGCVRVDVRVVVATHRNLDELVRSGGFRQDLYHRIYVFPNFLPPLRERRGDISTLVEHFSRRISEANGWKWKALTPAAVEVLERYPWPGNVRELRNAIERLLLLADDEVDESLVREALPNYIATPSRAASPASGTLASRVESFEREMIRAELNRARHNMTEAARVLGLERSHLYKKCAQLGINVKDLRREEE
jgi:DNA-binding NtrC family response regulator